MKCNKCESTYSDIQYNPNDRKPIFKVFDILDEVTSEVINQEYYCKWCLES